MIHLVFNIELLERYKGTDSKKLIIKIRADGEDWVMGSIVTGGLSDDNLKRHVFMVKWKDFMPEENTWETYENVAERVIKILEVCDKRNPAVERDGKFKDTAKGIGKRRK